ncbi:PREDICTED: venom peptide SjAPI-like [Trachymyrmex septentrionalis]|uniref:venom peptide SjAPI-like n=1 Tax=Trachymyrmex septentrionalis TaxID=34720 RepID=UPI00084F825D|nr:PREDICTED: venom peptide SjAPI-like [Trachymyrmex septentrionalis]
MSRIMIILFAFGLAIFVAADVFVLSDCLCENEELKCGSFCQRTCQTLDKPCAVVFACGCYCKEGYVRAKNPWDACIEIEDCN